MIGEVITNLNNVLDTVNAHSAQLSGLITSLQQFVSGFAQDREPIGEAISSSTSWPVRPRTCSTTVGSR
ncbi:hypothetical protein GCM10029964_043610 [Kibdelosporangium lantanae]